MSKTQRIWLLLVALAILVIASVLQYGRVAPHDDPSIVLFVALAMLAFTTLMLEHYFTRPTDVISASLAIILLLAPIQHDLPKWGPWYIAFMAYCGLMLVMAVTGLVLGDTQRPANDWPNRTSRLLYGLVGTFGNGRWLFFVLFVLSFAFYVDQHSWLLVGLAVFAGFFLLVDPSKALFTFLGRDRRLSRAEIGSIFGVQSRNGFIARLAGVQPSVEAFDLVAFKCSMGNERNTHVGMIIESYLLNEQNWVKVLRIDTLRTRFNELLPADPRPNVLYRLGENGRVHLPTFVGVVVDKSCIATIKFVYSGMQLISEGALIEATCGGETVLYQVVEGRTKIETLESKNQAGMIIGEAAQLGVWDSEQRGFDKHGWVPDINTPVLLAAAIEQPEIPTDCVSIGSIPNTNYPAILNLKEAINHHIAILGVTGSGKSVFARDLIRKVIAANTKVICVDFTKEYATKFADLTPPSIVAPANQQSLFDAIDLLAEQAAEFANRRDQLVIDAQEEILKTGFREAIAAFLQSDRKIALFELPDVSNTTGVLDYTKWFFKMLFNIARTDANFGHQVCVVLEEAHTIIPEWNSLGVDDKRSQAVVNAIGQIALQGRKNNVGFIVIAQRTANVSKTVLTQCNTIVAFQQFDKTSSEFLSYYVGEAMLKALPTLKRRHAIAVGIGFSSGVPMIFRVPDIHEP